MSHHVHSATEAAHRLDKRLAFSVVLNALLVLVEIAGGLLSGSLALLADAVHNASDVAALFTALVARKLGRRPPTVRFTYGLRRLEVLAALLNSTTLLVATTLLVSESVKRLLTPQPVRAGIMLGVAVAGLLANLLSVLLLHRHEARDLNMRAAFLHLVQDTLSSVVVVVAALLELGGADWATSSDAFAALLVALLILYGVYHLLKEVIRVLLQGTPEDLDLLALQSAFEETFPALRLHHVHAWERVPGEVFFTAHVLVPENLTSDTEALLAQVADWLASEYHVTHTTLQAEVAGCGENDLVNGGCAGNLQ